MPFAGKGLVMEKHRGRPDGNQVMVIQPYRTHGTWVFDDPVHGLVQEPFVSGIPEMIDILVQDIPNSNEGFRLLFSAGEIPDFQKKIAWKREDGGGNWYQDPDTGMEGWLCPALFKYFVAPPQTLYVKAETCTPTSTEIVAYRASYGLQEGSGEGVTTDMKRLQSIEAHMDEGGRVSNQIVRELIETIYAFHLKEQDTEP